LEVAGRVLERAVEQGTAPGVAAAVLRNGRLARLWAFGRRSPGEDAAPVEADTIFLVASLTKPVVCAGAMLLVQDGILALDQQVAALVKGFGKKGKDRITVRHLFTHTSGLPDQLPNNAELRQRHAPIEEFVQEVFQVEPLFPAGTKISYQSMGILILAEIVQRLTGQRLRDFLRERLFAPLGMTSTTLGLPDSGMERTALVGSPDEPQYGTSEADWGWNSPYWRDFGAPWGGLHSTASDLARFLAHMLGDLPGPLTPAAREAMVRDQTSPMPGISPEDKLTYRWGLGWALGLNQFGDLTSPDTFGHIGATGTVFWADPATHLACVLLTNQPGRNDYLFPRFSNAVASTTG
jgi:CubicO group peptidase (beta-lactamase class C family)